MALGEGASIGGSGMWRSGPGRTITVSRRLMTVVCASAAAAAVGWGVSAPVQAQQARLVVLAGERVSGGDDSGRPIPLVNADEEMAAYLKRAQEMAQKGDFAGAIEILQALLNRPEQCFVPTEDPRLYVSLGRRATEVIGDLPPQGMRMYRSLYDPPAGRLLELAEETHDEGVLREIIERYFHTRYGDKALNLLGTILFDRGEFSQAARCWWRILRAYKDSDLAPAVVLAKTAVAHHYADEQRAAQEALELLKTRYSDTQAVLGGTSRNVVAFAERMLTGPVPEFAPIRRVAEGWYSLAGAPDSVAVMSPCRPVLSPRWTKPGEKVEDNENIRALLGPTPPIPAHLLQDPRYRQQYQHSLALEEGRVMYRGRIGSAVRTVVLPAVIHPVVVGMMVLAREAGGVVAYDLLTGEKLWDTFDAFPLYQTLQATDGRRMVAGLYPHPNWSPEDDGLWTLTVGGGKVFAVGKFPPPLLAYQIARSRQGQVSDHSVLAAFSLTGEGKLVWRSEDEGKGDFLPSCRFLSAPTYVDGKLYVLVQHTQSYYLVCLDAETGRTIWVDPPMVSQAPPTGMAYSSGYYFSQESGSPPAVADGRVYACTNAGVLAAFDADSGRGLWAYQYDSSRNQMRLLNGRIVRSGQPTLTYPPNPIVVTRGRVICLPSDGEQVLALRADSGELEWAAERAGQRHLTAISETHVLLSAPRLIVMNAVNGKAVWAPSQPEDIHGRPAVTPDAVLASGKGLVVRVSLPDFSMAQSPLGTADAVLGNLVCVQGKLLAANVAGMSAYFDFAEAHAELTGRINKAAKHELPALWYQRGMNAFNDGRPEKALPDLLAAREGCQQAGQSALLARAEQSLYRVCVSLANRASDSAAMLEMFHKADGFAYSDRSRAEMLVRMVKYWTRVGQFAKAAAVAQKLAGDFTDTDLADVEIGPKADLYVRDDPETWRFTGYDLGHKLIGELIAQHGQSSYEAFDAKAKAELDAAIQADDSEAMVRVTDTYRHSRWAPLALLRAAESGYRRALKQPAEKLERLAEASEYLSRINMEYPDSDLAPSACLGRAMVYQRMKPNIAFLGLYGLKGLSGQTQVSFAGVSGSLAEVLRQFGTESLRSRPEPQPLAVSLAPPLAQLFGGGDEALILRDAAGQAVRHEQALFLLRGDRLCLFDPAAESFQQGLRWEAAVPLDSERLYRFGFASWAYGMVCGLSKDKSVFVAACRGGFLGVDVKTGKMRWHKGTDDSVVSRMQSLALGEDQLVVLDSTGSIVGLDLATGKQAFSHSITVAQLPWRAPAQIAGHLLVTVHGRTQWRASVYDLDSGKLLGSIPLGATGGQVQVTGDGLVLACDGRELRLIEPVLGLNQPIWSVGLPGQHGPMILTATDTQAAVSPADNSGLIELRSLVHHGMIERSFQTEAVGGQTAVPVSAALVGDRLYVVAGQLAGGNRNAILTGRLSYVENPSLQVFDRASGELLWVANLAFGGAQPYSYVMPLEVCRSHVSVLVKSQHYTRPSTAVLIDDRTGKIVQKFTVPGAQGVAVQMRYFRHMWLSGPVIINGRVVLETHKGLWVYGGRQ